MTVFRMFSPIRFLLVWLKLAGQLYWQRIVHLVLHTCWVGLFEVSWVATLLERAVYLALNTCWVGLFEVRSVATLLGRAVHLGRHTCWVGLFEVSWVSTLLEKSCLSGSPHGLGWFV